MKLKLLLMLLLVGGILCFYLLGYDQYFSIDYLKNHYQSIQGYFEKAPIQFVLAFLGLYVIVTALSIPGAALMTLAAGAFLGFWLGTLVVAVASTLGATLAFLISRYLLRNTVKQTFPKTVAKADRGIEREGAFYLFAMRLIVVIPFFLINLAMGLTNIKTLTYMVITLIGMLPGIMAYVNAGLQLSEVDALSEIFSIQVIASFAVIGLIPLASKKLINGYRRRREAKQNHN